MAERKNAGGNNGNGCGQDIISAHHIKEGVCGVDNKAGKQKGNNLERI